MPRQSGLTGLYFRVCYDSADCFWFQRIQWPLPCTVPLPSALNL